MQASFVHLHLHTEFSLIDGIVRIKPLMAQIRDLNMPAVAMTDQSNLFALVKFYKAAEGEGIKPLLGADLWVENEESVCRVTVLCQNRDGYLNLNRLISRAFLENQKLGKALVKRGWLSDANAGLIILLDGEQGDVADATKRGHRREARSILDTWMADFGDRTYLEVCRTGKEGEEQWISEALTLGEATQCPVVATNNVRFLKREDFAAHEARVCIHDGHILADSRRPKLYTAEQYLKSPEEMAELFHDLPETLENSVEIAKRCNLEFTFGEYFLPDIDTPGGVPIAEYLISESQQGLEQRLKDHGVDDNYQLSDYTERLQLELDIIVDMGFPGYFLIVAEFIDWARNNGVPVGPGRGSGAGSIVAWALGITDLDPLKYDLLFERFLNPERVSMPDFDVDFCVEGRDRVIDHVAELYGRDRVCQIITFGTMAAKAVVRDTGRVLGYPYPVVDGIAKLIPNTLGITLSDALASDEALKTAYAQQDEVREILDLALSLEGITRNAGTHAGGVVIAPTALTDFSPLYCEAGGNSPVTQYDKNDVETVGLVKFDFLGLKTLTVIQNALDAINEKSATNGAPKLLIENLPLDDKKTYSLLKHCDTTSVFQLESRGMKDLIRRLKPDCFNDIYALVALFRPGPLESGMVGDYVDRKHGRARVSYDHPDLEPVLNYTHGVILYQEQVMQIAQVLAGYTLGGADMLRRAMGKKKPEEMAKQRDVFVKGCVERNIEAKLANYIFDQMETFAGYGFNKSHSAAYAMIAYQTAYLKAHYPSEFMAAAMTADMDNNEKIAFLVDDCRHNKLAIVAPHVNRSNWRFRASSEREVVFGLGAIKGVGDGPVAAIADARAADGQFADVLDLCRRTGAAKINKRVFEALIRSGAMDELGSNRASIQATIPQALKIVQQEQDAKDSGQTDLFGQSAPLSKADADVQLPDWSEDQRLTGERDTLGFFLTGHPINKHLEQLSHFTSCRIGELEKRIKPTTGGYRQKGQLMHLAGLVNSVRKRDRMTIVGLDDHSGQLDVVFYRDAAEGFAELLIKDRIIVVEGEVRVDDFSGGFKMSSRSALSIDKACAHFAKGLEIRVQSPQDSFISLLKSSLSGHVNGNSPVWIKINKENTEVSYRLGDEWRISISPELISTLRDIPGVQKVTALYGK